MNSVAMAIQEREKNDNNKMDTVTKARQEREENGPWEVEISYGGEADLHRQNVICDKNPEHLKFVPVDEFDVGHLPSGWQDNLLVDMIRTMSELTVRVSVKYVSEGRPGTVTASGKPYPFYKNRGSDMMRVGTGSVWGVDMNPDKDNNPTCGCKECLNSPTSKTQFAQIYISTAVHVVWDGLEGADTTCHLFFDRGGTPDKCDGVIALSGTSRVMTDIGADWCVMVYVTHNLDLAHRLDKMVDHQRNLMSLLTEKYGPRENPPARYNNQKTGSEPDPLEKMAIIVSHPHGCSKQVSVGYWTNIDGRKDGDNQVSYTTATCPGSSGAHVCLVGEGMEYIYSGHVHCANCEVNKELNLGSWVWSHVPKK